MKTNLLVAGIALVVLGRANAVHADPFDHAAIDAPPQHYVMTLPRAPVGEVAEEVLGQTLGLPVTTDERVDARMSFRIDGVYSPKELAREFGYQLWNVDVVLIEDKAHALKLIPAAVLPEAISQGAEVVSPLALEPTARTVAATRSGRRPITYGQRRWHDNGWWRVLALIGALGLGWLGGMLTPAVLVWLKARLRDANSPGPSLWLSAPDRPPNADDDLAIPDPRPSLSKEIRDGTET